MRWLALLLFAGCGRFGFDPATGDARGAHDAGDARGPDVPLVCGPFSAPVQLTGAVQSSSDDWFPTPSASELELYMYRYIGAGGNSEIVRATRATVSDSFGPGTIVTELVTTTDEKAPTLSEDGLRMVFVRLDTPSHVWEATRSTATGPFETPTMIMELATAADDQTPWLSPDGLRLLFSSQRGSRQIVEATRVDRASSWSAAVVLANVNSSDDDENPTLTADGLELFFSSARPGGPGRLDVYRSKRAALDQPFEAPVLVPELSTPLDDLGLRLSRDGRTMYLNYDSDSAGGQNAQVWTATRVCE